MKSKIEIPRDEIIKFCQKWKISEFALFGSVIRDDFGPESDIDVCVTFAQDAHPDLYDLAVMEDELHEIFKRNVDIVEKAGLRNPFRRREILNNLEIVYAA
jgi:hypothetical protein